MNVTLLGLGVSGNSQKCNTFGYLKLFMDVTLKTNNSQLCFEKLSRMLKKSNKKG